MDRTGCGDTQRRASHDNCILSLVPFTVPDQDLRPMLPKQSSLRIGILGCGEIVNIAHLPAYKGGGLNVVSCFDTNESAARETAEKFGIHRVCTSLEELVSDAGVDIIDIAIHLNGRTEAFQRAAEAGKSILLQKPVAHSMQEAEAYVSMAETKGIKYAVNQQARWAGTHLAIKRWITDGAIGRMNSLRLDMRGWQDDPSTWYVACPDFTMVDHGIHYFDLLRFFAGREAQSVSAMQTTVPDQVNISPTVYMAIVDFGDGLIAEHSFHNKVETPSPWDMSIVVDGDEGSILGNFSTVTLVRKDGTKIVQTPSSKWFPYAFLGPIADLMDAITENREPIVSGRSNLGTMKLLLGALESADRRRVVQLM